MKFLKTIAIALFAFSCHITAKGEEQEWENLPVKSLSWSKNTSLNYYTYSNTDLSVWNSNENTAEKGHWNREESYIQFSQLAGRKNNRKFIFQFSIRNENNQPSKKYRVYGTNKKGNREEKWHENNIYWGFQIDMNTISGGTSSYTQYFADRKSYNSAYYYTDVWNSDRQSWASGRDVTTRHFKLEFDGSSTAKLSISEDGTNYESIKTFTSVSGIKYFNVELGSAAYVHVSNLSYVQLSDYGVAKPEIDKAISEYNQGNYSKTISIISNLLNNYKAAFPYYIRGRAYSSNKLNKAAIDDFSSALTYSCDAELRRNIYFNRGICRLLLDDYDNGVADMRNAGEEGKAFLKEYNLENYQPGQRKAASGGSRNNSSGSSSTPQLRKGNSSSNSQNSTPALRKTN